jgi:hypothetical protein
MGFTSSGGLLFILFIVYTVLVFVWLARRSSTKGSGMPLLLNILAAPLAGLVMAAATQFLIALARGPI